MLRHLGALADKQLAAAWLLSGSYKNLLDTFLSPPFFCPKTNSRCSLICFDSPCLPGRDTWPHLMMESWRNTEAWEGGCNSFNKPRVRTKWTFVKTAGACLRSDADWEQKNKSQDEKTQDTFKSVWKIILDLYLDWQFVQDAEKTNLIKENCSFESALKK